MAKNPCKIFLKDKPGGSPVEYSYDEVMAMLKDGMLMDLINNNTLDEGRMKGENPFIAAEPEPVKRMDLKSLAGKGKALKTLLARAFVGTTDEKLAEALRKTGLDRDVQKLTESRARAKEFVEMVGFEAAYQAVKDRKMNDGVAAFVYAELIDRLEAAKFTSFEDSSMTQEEYIAAMNELLELQAKMINEFSAVATAYGQFTNALKDIYRNSLFNYSLDNQVNEYKKANFNYISPEIQTKFEALDEKIKDLNMRIAEAEKRAQAAEDARNLAEIAQAVAEDKLANMDTQDTAQQSAEEVRKFKFKAVSFKDANGKPLNVPKEAWNKIVEAAAKAVEGIKNKPSITSKSSLSGPASSTALAAALDAVRNEPWFQALSAADQKAIENQIKSQFTSTTPGKISVPASLISSIVQDGVTDMNDLVTKVMAQISSKYPNATEREVRDAISGYGRERSLTKSDMQKEIATLRNIGRMESRLEDIQRGLVKAKTPQERAKLTDKESQLKMEIQDAYEVAGIADAQRLINAKQNAKKRIAELERRLQEGDFSKKERKKVIEDDELRELRAERQTLQNQFDKEVDKIKKENSTSKFLDGLSGFWEVSRLLQATFDLSMVLVQGLKLTVSHPIHAARSFAKTFEHFTSEKKARKWGEFIKSQPYYEEMMKAGLSLSEYDASLSEKEEGFLGGVGNSIFDFLAKPMKLFGEEAYQKTLMLNPFKAFERAGIGYLNTMRVLRYLDGKAMLEKQGKTFETDPKSYENVAEMVNTFTGRASLGPLNSISGPLSKIFYSPKNWASQLKTSTVGFPIFLLTLKDQGTFKPSVAQKMAARDFVVWFATTAGIVSMIAAKANEDDEDEFEVDLNPLSSKFGKIRIGDMYIDPWGGFIQHIVLQARLYNDALVRGGEKKKLGEYNTPTRGGLIAEFAQNKFHPTMSLLVGYLTTHDEDGKRVNPYGEEFIWSDQVLERTTPMIFSTINEIFTEEPNLKGAFLSAYAFLGSSINVYKDKKMAPKYTNPATSTVMKEFKPKGIPDIQKDTFAVPLTDEQLIELNAKYRDKAAPILDIYASKAPSLESKELFPKQVTVTDNELEEGKIKAMKKGVPEADLEKEGKTIAIETKKREKISSDIGELAKLAREAAAAEYFASIGKTVPVTLKDAVDDYNKKLKKLQENKK